MKILHFADLHLGVETYGHINPQSGLSTRLEDILKALDDLIDYALQNKVDLVLFCGDAYKSREPGQTQQREFARRIKRLSGGGIPIFLLVGNHDLPSAMSGASTPEIFDTLAIDNVYVSNRPQIHRIQTASGAIQIASLPWVRRSTMLAKEESKGLSLEQINQKLQQALTNIITNHAQQLDPALPAILAAHVWVSGARLGTEKSMTIGQEQTLLPGNVANPAFDYIALGHIHRHQVLLPNPPLIYSGSLARLDFGDEEDEKGFYIIEIEPEKERGRRTTFEFYPLAGRRFLTINVDIDSQEIDPTATVLRAIAAQGDKVNDAIVRLNISLTAELEGQLRDNEIRSVLKQAHYLSITRDVRRETRLRLGKWTAEEITPVDALKKYVESNKFSPEQAKHLLEYGEKLIGEREGQVNK
ncbi:MAG: exonuclease SbcCD subunit D [Chloroflexi bacterium]|nr:exonuclease SbcCD subunit D [Chloroflexota bacterium]